MIYTCLHSGSQYLPNTYSVLDTQYEEYHSEQYQPGPCLMGYNQSGDLEQEKSYRVINKCSDGRSTVVWQHLQGQQAHPNGKDFSLQTQLSESSPDPLFQSALLVYPPPSSSFMELPCPFWMNHVLPLIHAGCLFLEPGSLSHPFSQNTNYPQGSAQMSPLQQNQPQSQVKINHPLPCFLPVPGFYVRYVILACS